MSDFIGIDVYGIEETKARLAYITSEEAAGVGVEAANAYLVQVLRAYPPQAAISRAQAYPGAVITLANGRRVAGYFSVAQFKKVMSLVALGRVPYHRTQTLNHAWQTLGSGVRQIVVNETPYAGYVMGNGRQANQQRLGGWQTDTQIIQRSIGRVASVFAQGYRRFLRSIGL